MHWRLCLTCQDTSIQSSTVARVSPGCCTQEISVPYSTPHMGGSPLSECDLYCTLSGKAPLGYYITHRGEYDDNAPLGLCSVSAPLTGLNKHVLLLGLKINARSESLGGAAICLDPKTLL